MAKAQKKQVKKAAKKAVLQNTPAWIKQPRWVGIGLFLLGFLLYANTFTHDFAQDDAIVIYDNMFTQEGFDGISGILSKDTFFGFFKEEGKAALVAGGRYRPLTLVMFAIEVQFFGLNPTVGHVFNAIYYGLCCWVLYIVLLQFFQERYKPEVKYILAFLITLLFTTHPIHTEAIANIKGRDEIIALLGSLLTVYFAFRYYKTNKLVPLLISAGIFFLALLAKENTITFLAIVPLSLYFFTKASAQKIAQATVPLLAVTVLFLVIRSSVLGFTFSEPSKELMNNPFLKLENNQYIPFSESERLATITYTLGKYAVLLLVPHPLTHDYYPRQVDIQSWGDWPVLLSLLFYLALLGIAIYRFRAKDPIAYGILFYLITLSIVSNVLFAVGTNMSERFVFMPSVGVCIAIVFVAFRLLVRGLNSQKQPTQFKQFYSLFALISVIALAFSIKTIVRNPAWKDNFTLFTTDIYNSPNSAKLRNAIGGELVTQSVNEKNESKRVAMLEEASGHLKEAIRIHPTYKNAYLLLGNCYNYLKQYEASIDNYNKALQLDPNYADAEKNLGITYREAGKFYGETKGDINQAITYLERAYQLRPSEYETVRLLGVAYGNRGNLQNAVKYFTIGTQLAPQNADAWFNLGLSQYNAGNQGDGDASMKKAVELDPSKAQVIQQMFNQ